MKSLFAPMVAAALVVAGAVAASAQQDTILKTDGVTVKGKITKQSWQSVTYLDEKGKAVTLKGSEIGSITFGDEPQAFLSAKNAEIGGLPDKAVIRFEEAIKEVDAKKGSREWNKAPIFLRWGKFLADRGDVAAGLAMLKRIRTECGDSWWRPESYREGFKIAKTIEDQKAVMDEMKTEPEPLASEAEMELAALAATRSDFDEALAIYNKVASTTASPYVESAKLGIFRTLKQQKKTSDLDAYCKKVLDDPTSTPSIQQAAGAWAAGALLEKAGKDKAKIRGALLAAGKAIAMGPPERKEEAEDYIAALRVAAKAYTTLAGETSKPDQQEEYKTRASGYLMEIVRAYKGTPWAEAANLELQTLGVK